MCYSTFFSGDLPPPCLHPVYVSFETRCSDLEILLADISPQSLLTLFFLIVATRLLLQLIWDFLSFYPTHIMPQFSPDMVVSPTVYLLNVASCISMLPSFRHICPPFFFSLPTQDLWSPSPCYCRPLLVYAMTPEILFFFNPSLTVTR